MESLINKSIYYWDWYLVHGEKDYLVAAWQFMLDFRKLGGLGYEETEKAMVQMINIVCPMEIPKRIKKETKKPREIKNDIFGMSWEELESKQGGKLIR